MSDDQPSSAAVHPVKRLALKTEQTVRRILVEHNPQRLQPTRSDCQNKIVPKVIRWCRGRGNLKRQISVRRSHSWWSFALSDSNATQLGESPGTAFVRFVRERR